MDLTSTVRSDVLPAVGSMLVPGALASSPYLALVWGPPHDLGSFADANQGAATAAAALVVVSVGLLIESLGSYVEYYVIDRRHDDSKAMLADWALYLKIAWIKEPIGQHYLRKILIIFKFELNLLVSTAATVPGVAALGIYGVLPAHGTLYLLASAFGLALYLCKASVDSSKLLATLRGQLIEEARRQGALPPADTAA